MGCYPGCALCFFGWLGNSKAMLVFLSLVILLCFWLINVFTGRIMLGDLGAYALGALVVFVAFNLFDEQGVSLFSSRVCSVTLV